MWIKTCASWKFSMVGFPWRRASEKVWLNSLHPTHTHTQLNSSAPRLYPWKKIRNWWGPIINYPRPVAHSWELWTQGTFRHRCSWDLIFGLLGSMMMTPMISMASISQIPCQLVGLQRFFPILQDCSFNQRNVKRTRYKWLLHKRIKHLCFTFPGISHIPGAHMVDSFCAPACWVYNKLYNHLATVAHNTTGSIETMKH